MAGSTDHQDSVDPAIGLSRRPGSLAVPWHLVRIVEPHPRQPGCGKLVLKVVRHVGSVERSAELGREAEMPFVRCSARLAAHGVAFHFLACQDLDGGGGEVEFAA
jgi:hypothetical protein